MCPCLNSYFVIHKEGIRAQFRRAMSIPNQRFNTFISLKVWDAHLSHFQAISEIDFYKYDR